MLCSSTCSAASCAACNWVAVFNCASIARAARPARVRSAFVRSDTVAHGPELAVAAAEGGGCVSRAIGTAPGDRAQRQQNQQDGGTSTAHEQDSRSDCAIVLPSVHSRFILTRANR